MTLKPNRRSNAVLKSRPSSKPLALGLVGVGLVVLGLVATLWLQKDGAGLDQVEENNPYQVTPAQVDYAAPDLRLTDLDGNPVTLADYRGKVVLVNNWATWCPPCQAEMPTLQAYYQSHHTGGFEIIAIAAGQKAEQINSFVKDNHLTFSFWPDPDTQALAAFKSISLPSSFVIDRTGMVRLMWMGAIEENMLEKFVTPLVEAQ